MYYEKIYLFQLLWTFALVNMTLLSIVGLAACALTTQTVCARPAERRAAQLVRGWSRTGHDEKVLDDAYVSDVYKNLGVCLCIDLKLYPGRKRNASLIAEMGHTFSSAHSQVDGAFMFYLMEFNADRIVAVNVLHEICETLRKSSGPRPRAPEIMHSFRSSSNEPHIYRRPVGPSELDYVYAVVSKP